MRKSNNKASITVFSSFFIKSKTNSGEIAKQYCTVAKNDTCDTSLILRKLVYTDNIEMYKRGGFKLLRKFKGYGLFEKYFSIKLSTLKVILETINIQNTKP